MALVTLEETKVYLRIEPDDTEFDELLDGLILKVSTAINTLVDKTLESTTYSQLLDGSGDFELALDNYPIVTISALSMSLDRTNKEYSSPVTIADLLIHNRAGIVEMVENTFDPGQKNVFIKYTSGYAVADVPQDLKLVCLNWIYKKWLDVENQRIGIAVKNVMSENVSFIYNDLNKEDRQTIDLYRKRDRIKKGVDVTGWGAAS